jgi:aspartate aminotransferase-like enzyme
MMSGRAAKRLEATTPSSFAGDLKNWRQITKSYEDGGHAYQATMPTDGLRDLRDTMIESRYYGFERLMAAQLELGRAVRAHLTGMGVLLVAAEGFEAPGVVVCYTGDPAVKSGAAFVAEGMQIAAGVPL